MFVQKQGSAAAWQAGQKSAHPCANSLQGQSLRAASAELFSPVRNLAGEVVAERPTLQALAALCVEAEPHVAAVVRQLHGTNVGVCFEDEQGYTSEADRVLRGSNICGVASCALGYLVLTRGYATERYRTQELDGSIYPCHGHTLLGVRVDDAFGLVRVDAAYMQFLKILSLAPDKLPKENTLILKAEELDMRMQQLAGLWRYAGDGAGRLMWEGYTRRVLTCEDDLVGYLRRVWDIEGRHYSIKAPDELASKLRAYRRGQRDLFEYYQPLVLDALSERGLI